LCFNFQTSELHLLETYKSDSLKFALCAGRLSADNLLVMQVGVAIARWVWQ